MPRGDGTGPLGTGPIKRNLKSGNMGSRGLGKNRNCPRQGRLRNSDSRNGSSKGLFSIPSLLLTIATVAVPAIAKVQQLIRERKAEKQLNWEQQESNVITIQAEEVESGMIKKK